MIFEFLKKLFWKADEGSRKRKTSDCNFQCPDTKKYRFDNESFMKVDDSVINNVPNNHVKFSAWSPLSNNKMLKADKCLLNKNYQSFDTFESMNQTTLYNTIRLAEKKQYQEMISKFVSDKPQFIEPDSRKDKKKKVLEFSGTNNNVTSNIRKKLDYSKDHVDKRFPKSSLAQPPILFITQYQNNKIQNRKKNRDHCLVPSDRSPIEIIQTNTLRDEFSSKKVLKQDFLTQISEKYSKKTEQCQKAAQELKKVTCMLARHNQLLREAAFEDQLSRSMRLCEVILDEREIAEKYALPELSDDMKTVINNALSTASPHEILVESFGLRITRKDIQTLAGLNWLNDEVINFYMNLLIARGENTSYPSVYAMNTFFYPKLLSGGHASLRRWTRKVDIFAKDILVVPIHLGIHWCMSIVDFQNKSIQYFDSMGAPNQKCLQALQQYLYDESMDKRKKPFSFQNWTFECVQDIPQQMNGSDCGVFSCMFAEYICAKKPLNFSQEDMPYFRKKMVYEILTARLL